MPSSEETRKNPAAEPELSEMDYTDISLGYDSNGSTGDTALMLATREGLPDVVKFLLEKKADANLINNNKFRALDYAMSFLNKYKSRLEKSINSYSNTVNQIYFQRYHDIACMLKPITTVGKIDDIKLDCDSVD